MAVHREKDERLAPFMRMDRCNKISRLSNELLQVRAETRADPLEVLGWDVFFFAVLPRLDARSLAACIAVSSSWRACCISDVLWRPLLSRFLALRAHLPLALLRCSSPFPPHLAYSVAMLDACKAELSPAEMCARVWEMKVKPTCGPYWYSLDPTSLNEAPLLRRFHCDFSITPLQENDPIWGGQESTWKFVKSKQSNGELKKQFVRINSWPQHQVVRLRDGRWCLDNYYASYTTCPDQEENMPSYLKGLKVPCCRRCNPDQIELIKAKI
ncbi:hypothetical protein KP509_01G115900 [Ceratopteris richardii]|uniref:F-box domain-containing protein n=1 Tax=Ceratopteris richardii TaxID=49495 RepID=A0A8T2VQ77_CERRI|nr:hypothetical protein KP509_01G115900 [Ceratopteris richardii]